MRTRLFALLAGCSLWLVTSPASAQNCCMPKLEEDGSHTAELIEGIQLATAFLIAVPFSLVAGMTYWYCRRLNPALDESRQSDTHNAAHD